VVFRIFGESYRAARVGQAILGALTCVLLYKIGTQLANPAVGWASGLLLAIYPPHIYLAGVFYAECVATFLGVLSIYLAIRSVRPAAPLALSLVTGITLALTALARSVFAIFAPWVCVAWLCDAPKEWRRRLLCSVLFCCGFACMILPWTIRNYVVYRRVMPISTGFYQQLWFGNNVLSTGSAEDRFLGGESFWNERLQQLDPADQLVVTEKYATIRKEIAEKTVRYGDATIALDEVLRPVVTSYIAAHPGLTIFRWGKKLVAMFLTAFGNTLTTNTYTARPYKLIAAASYYPILVLALVGAGLSLPRWREFALIYLVIIVVAGVQAMMTVNTRYRLPLDPFLIVFASIALVRLWPWKPAAKTSQ
jgi:4-amino-4-deoxy-L-arabinose transferase-like glycosyltransferase